ncbi:MAG: Loki-CTERM sorting domain-containing protein [Promethearchaeota archaeon]
MRLIPSVPPGIPGYDLAILIGILIIISGIIIRKRQRK